MKHIVACLFLFAVAAYSQTQTLINNASISGPFTSASFTIPASVSGGTVKASYVGPPLGGGTFSYNIDTSADGGTTWITRINDNAGNGFVKNTSAVVNTNNKTVTWVSGNQFTSALLNQPVSIGGNSFTVASVTSATQLTLTGVVGTLSNVSFAEQPTFIASAPITSDIIGNLIRANIITATGGTWVVTITLTTN